MPAWLARLVAWVKGHALALSAAGAAILAALGAAAVARRERRRAVRAEASLEAEQGRTEAARQDAVATVHEQQAETLGARAAVASDEAARETAKAVEAEVKAQELPHDQLVDRLNSIARTRHPRDPR